MKKLSIFIRNEFQQNDIVKLHDLYEKYVETDSSDGFYDKNTELKNARYRQKHKIRAILNQLRTKNEIVNVGEGIWKKKKN